MFAEVDGIPIVFHLAAAGINKAHERVAAVQCPLRECDRYRLCRFTDTDAERCISKQTLKPLQGRPFKHKRDKVIGFVIEEIGDVFAVRHGNREPIRDLSTDADNAVILPVQLGNQARTHPLRPGDQRGEGQSPFAGQFIRQAGAHHAGQRIQECSAVIDFKSHIISPRNRLNLSYT